MAIPAGGQSEPSHIYLSRMAPGQLPLQLPLQASPATRYGSARILDVNKAANTARGYSREPGPETLPSNRTTPKDATRPMNPAHQPCPPNLVPGGPSPVTWRDSLAQLPLLASPAPSPGFSTSLQSLSHILDPLRPDTTTGCVTLCTNYLVSIIM